MIRLGRLGAAVGTALAIAGALGCGGGRGAAAKRAPVAVRAGDRCRASGVGGAQGSVMKMLAIMFAAALLVAGCGGGKSAGTAGTPSSNPSVSSDTKRAGARR